MEFLTNNVVTASSVYNLCLKDADLLPTFLNLSLFSQLFLFVFWLLDLCVYFDILHLCLTVLLFTCLFCDLPRDKYTLYNTIDHTSVVL